MKRFVCLLFLCLAFQGVVVSQEKNIEMRNLFPVVIKGKEAFIDKNGKVVLTPEEAAAEANKPKFSEGLAAVKIDDKWCYIDQNRKVVIKTNFDMVGPFQNGYALVELVGKKTIYRRVDDGESISEDEIKYGFIDKAGNVVVKPIYDEFYGFSEGMGRVVINDKWGFIDYTGKIVIEPQFSGAYWFSEGIACVILNNEGDSAYIDKTGKIVSDPRYEYSYDWFSDCLISASDGKKIGYLDKNWKVAIPFQFDDTAQAFSEGLAAVKVGDKWGYIDTKGKFVVPPKFDQHPGAFSEGMATVQVNGKYGYIDRTGRMVIEPQFLSANSFQNGLATVTNNDSVGKVSCCWNRWDYIDKNGKYVWRSE